VSCFFARGNALRFLIHHIFSQKKYHRFRRRKIKDQRRKQPRRKRGFKVPFLAPKSTSFDRDLSILLFHY
jgi:hypothetical protein